MLCSIEVNDAFGPAVTPECRGGFDLTLLFEELVLSIVPTVIVSLLLPIRAYHLISSDQHVQKVLRHHLKLLMHACFAVLQAIMLILLCIPGLIPKTRASIATVALSTALAFALVPLSHLEHTRSFRPSALLSLYFGLSMLFDAARARTLWCISDNVLFAVFFSINLGFRLVLFILESLQKQAGFKPSYQELALEEAVNVFNRNTFWWLNSLLFDGFRHVLRVATLPTIDGRLFSIDSQLQLFAKWDSVRQKSASALIKLLAFHYKWAILSAVPARLALSAFTFAQPFLISRIVSFAVQSKNDLDGEIGSSLIVATGLVYIGLALSTANSQHKTYRLITILRGALVSLVHRKTLDTSVVAARASAAVTLMSTDVERIGVGLRLLHEIWASPIDIGVGIYLLTRQLGPAGAAPGVLFLLISLAGLRVAASMGARQKVWVEAIQLRVSVTSDTLSAIKEVRMGGLQSKMKSKLSQLREDEIQSSKGFKNALALIVCLSYTTTALAPAVSFMIFQLLARKNHTQTLNTEIAFTSLALFALLRTPMSMVIDAVAGFVSTIGGLQRIGEYVSAEDSKQHREHQSETPSLATENFDRKELTDQHEGKSAIALTTFCDSEHDDLIVARDFSAGWDESKPFVVKDLDFTIRRSTMTIVVGPVGCGKTTFLNALLGETIRNRGSRHVRFSHAAFCGQTPWLTNGTIRSNIIGANLYDKPWYDQVVDACAIADDLSDLPRGDQETVGVNGANLSGGQQARVAVAKAIYSKKEVILLDDVISGLDARTEDKLFNNLLGERGLLRRGDHTVIFATNAVHRLSAADNIIVLNSEGRIQEQGRFDQLSATAVKHAQSVPSAFQDGKPKFAPDKPPAAPFKTTEDTGGVDRRTGDWTVYEYYTRAVGIVNVIIFLTAGACFVFGLIFPQYLVKWWAEDNQSHPGESPKLGAYLTGYYALAVMAIASLALAAWHLTSRIMPKASTAFHRAILDTSVNARQSFFSETDVGETVNRFSQDLQLIDMELPLALFNTSIEFLSCIAQLIMIMASAKFIAAALPAVLVAFWLVQKFYLRTGRQLRLLDIEAKGPLFSQFIETLAGLVTIRAYGWQKEESRRNQATLDVSQRPFYLLVCVQRWLNLVLDFIVAGIAIVVVSIATKTKGNIDPGLVGVALVNIINFSVSIKALLANWTQLETCVGAVARVRGFERTTESEHQPIEKYVPPVEWPDQGAVRFHRVSASWEGNSKPVLSDLDFSAEPGQKLAICGKSGSGKSSIISTLFRLLDPSSGSITIDNIDISTVPRNELRSRLICVTQKPYLVSGTVRENVDPYGMADEHAILAALEDVQMLDYVSELGGIDSELDSEVMSIGQKQLLCLARATLRKGSILILDEATASLDFDTDELVQGVIRRHFVNRTIITIAHRLNTILDYDRVAVISEGRLIEFDSPANLLAQQPPTTFAALYAVSAGCLSETSQHKPAVEESSVDRQKQRQNIHRKGSFKIFPCDDTVASTPISAITEPSGCENDDHDWYPDQGSADHGDNTEDHAPLLLNPNGPLSPVRSAEQGTAASPSGVGTITRLKSMKQRMKQRLDEATTGQMLS
ncbi:hypothetical protein GJ744_001941 [Endocarpon pusillum]|uniref:Uncharacterized protein n=1 Tax=Endocarpon pusillum TaxID=364733 RepID=A0A8H7ANK1_9EURO|nr:hypothetical protein GJ744_001941 [Endocarpon pusillum]